MAQAPKTKKIVLPILGEQSKYSEALRQVKIKKQHFKMKLWSWGPLTIWHNMASVQ